MELVSTVEQDRRLGELEARGAGLAGVLNATSAALVSIIYEVLDGELWNGRGLRSPEHWVQLRFGVSPTRARRLVGAARALQVLPQVRKAFEAGETSEDHVAEITRAEVSEVHDEQVVTLAREASVPQLRRGLSFLPPEPKPEGEDEDEPESGPSESVRPKRQVGFGYGDDGSWRLSATLPADEGALVQKAIEAGRDAEFRARHGREPDPGAESGVGWADGLVRLATAGLDGLDPSTRAGASPSERYVVNLHVRADEPGAPAAVHLGPALPVSLRRYLLCDATVRAWVADQLGNVGPGRKARVVDPKLRAVIEHRDGGCIVPGCSGHRWLVAHHIQHWENGGPTETWNLVCLCRAHHRLVHSGQLRISGDPGRPATLRLPDDHGRPIGPSPPVPPDVPPDQAARRLGVADGSWRIRGGEPADWKCVYWHEHPPSAA